MQSRMQPTLQPLKVLSWKTFKPPWLLANPPPLPRLGSHQHFPDLDSSGAIPLLCFTHQFCNPCQFPTLWFLAGLYPEAVPSALGLSFPPLPGSQGSSPSGSFLDLPGLCCGCPAIT